MATWAIYPLWVDLSRPVSLVTILSGGMPTMDFPDSLLSMIKDSLGLASSLTIVLSRVNMGLWPFAVSSFNFSVVLSIGWLMARGAIYPLGVRFSRPLLPAPVLSVGSPFLVITAVSGLIPTPSLGFGISFKMALSFVSM